MGDTCLEFNYFFTVRRSCWAGEIKGREINSLLRSGCIERGFIYINNDNILLSDIQNKPRDKVHLLESGSVKLANNIVRVLNGEF